MVYLNVVEHQLIQQAGQAAIHMMHEHGVHFKCSK